MVREEGWTSPGPNLTISSRPTAPDHWCSTPTSPRVNGNGASSPLLGTAPPRVALPALGPLREPCSVCAARLSPNELMTAGSRPRWPGRQEALHPVTPLSVPGWGTRLSRAPSSVGDGLWEVGRRGAEPRGLPIHFLSRERWERRGWCTQARSSGGPVSAASACSQRPLLWGCAARRQRAPAHAHCREGGSVPVCAGVRGRAWVGTDVCNGHRGCVHPPRYLPHPPAAWRCQAGPCQPRGPGPGLRATGVVQARGSGTWAGGEGNYDSQHAARRRPEARRALSSTSSSHAALLLAEEVGVKSAAARDWLGRWDLFETGFRQLSLRRPPRW